MDTQKIGLNDYKFDQDSGATHDGSTLSKRIQEIANLSVRCRDSDGERHGVDHNCIACKPWLILKRINENEEKKRSLTDAALPLGGVAAPTQDF